MSTELQVRSSSGTYGVHLGPGGFDTVLSRGGDVVVVDAALRHLVPPRDSPVLVVEATEAEKTLGGCERLITGLLEAGVRRGDHLLAVGGGAVQDIVTFVADVYMRGLPWSYVPTTLMSMADSCIGGKSAINVGNVKNLVGGIHPPESVIIDPAFLGSLSPTAVAAGLSEAVKIAYCRGPEAFEGYLERYDCFDADPTALIEHVLRAKVWFVEIDEHDVLERRLLNFGHTFGHALETAVEHTLSHGLAVATGMLCAIRHPASGAGPHVEALEAHCRGLLACAPGLADSLARFDAGRFELAFRSDKKHGSSTFRLILPTAQGAVAEVEREATAAEWALVDEATRTTLDSLTGESR